MVGNVAKGHDDRSDIFKVHVKRTSFIIVTADKTRTFRPIYRLHAITLICKLYLLGMCWVSGMESYLLYVRVCICVGLHVVVLDGTATNFVYSSMLGVALCEPPQ